MAKTSPQSSSQRRRMTGRDGRDHRNSGQRCSRLCRWIRFRGGTGKRLRPVDSSYLCGIEGRNHNQVLV